MSGNVSEGGMILLEALIELKHFSNRVFRAQFEAAVGSTLPPLNVGESRALPRFSQRPGTLSRGHPSRQDSGVQGCGV